MSDQNKFFLKPGNSVQGDSNVRHPAGDILNIKGFYEQNSHVMPENLIECTGVLAHGVEDEWCEYVPASYDGTTPVSLVISRHGGGQSGWGQCYATSWIYVAEQHGFIVVFPTTRMPALDASGPMRLVGDLEPNALCSISMVCHRNHGAFYHRTRRSRVGLKAIWRNDALYGTNNKRGCFGINKDDFISLGGKK